MALLLITFPQGITLIRGFFELFPFWPFLYLIRHAHFFLCPEKYQETIFEPKVDIKPEIDVKLEEVDCIKDEKD